MKVSDKIALIKMGVKFSEIAELEKQELEELKQELNDSEEEQTSKEKKDIKEEEAETPPDESKGEAEESKENEELARLQEENKKMKELLHKANILNSGTGKGEEPEKKLTPVDVMNQLFHPEENGGKK